MRFQFGFEVLGAALAIEVGGLSVVYVRTPRHSLGINRRSADSGPWWARQREPGSLQVWAGRFELIAERWRERDHPVLTNFR